MQLSPIPAARRGPVIVPRASQLDQTTTGDPVQDPNAAESNPSNFLAFSTGDNGIGTNTSYDFYTVPAGKLFVCTSCICSENTSTAANIQFVKLIEVGGVGKVANAYLYGGQSVELLTNGAVTFHPGTTVRITSGGATTSTIAAVSGYLTDVPVVDPSGAPPEQSQISSTPQG